MEALPEARAPIRPRTPQGCLRFRGLPGRLGRVARARTRALIAGNRDMLVLGSHIA
jgi:hypothetical protein